ncbi:extracellular solute-binding protein [Streptomyces sp. NPDC050428]|uniref:extracellular solute-binding protein n=1 Tax=Streptomyces sp. NPDC050428 TaxID=3155757 RepID=UPI003415B8E6
MATLMARLTRCAVALGLLLTAVACGSGPPSDRLTVMVPWSGPEFQAFYSVIRSFEEDTGIQVDVLVTRAQTQQLDAAVAADAPPDLAVLPSVGALDQYARDDSLKPLDAAITEDYTQPFRGLGIVQDKVYAVPVKADVKSLIWYTPEVTLKPPSTKMPALQALSRERPETWCLGLASGPTSGWPGADWIADMLLSQSGTDTYKDWLSGELEWNSPEVRAAWKAWRSIVADSVKNAPEKKFSEAAGGMTAKPPTCALAHGTLSAMSFPPSAVAEEAYDYVTSAPEPKRRLEVSADFVGRFTKNPSGTALITYLSSAKAQQAWVNQPGGYGFSARGQGKPLEYENPVQKRIAKMLRPNSGYTLCFSAADAMAPDLSAAFYRAVLDYTADASRLKSLLKGLDKVQLDRNSPVPPDKLCAPAT